MPVGWRFDYNQLYERHDDSSAGDSPVEVLLLTHYGARIAINMEWRPELCEGRGAYFLRVIYAPWKRTERGRRIKNAPLEFDWENPVYQAKIEAHRDLVADVQTWLVRALSLRTECN